VARSRGGSRDRPVDIWPGFVDALSTLLLSLIFLLVVFVLGQFFLGQLLQGRNETVLRLEDRVRDLGAELELERDAAAELRRSLTRLNADGAQAARDRDDLQGRLSRSDAERDRAAERAANLAEEQARLQQALGTLRGEAEQGRVRASELERALAEARRTVTADKATLEVQLGQLARLRQEVAALAEARRELEGRTASLAAAQAEGDEERRRLAQDLASARDRASALEAQAAGSARETELARREVGQRDQRVAELERALRALEAERATAGADRERAVEQAQVLGQQVATVGRQLLALDQALGQKQQEIDRQSAAIADLGTRLNVALASKVEELSGYRSEFFGRLRQALGTREDVRTVGDRFVFQSEVLFPVGGAEIDPGGQAQLAKLAAALREITDDIPAELPWVLQVDGHTDRRRISTPRFPSNWELSTARAISVARFLVTQGIPAERVAASGFAEFQPLDAGESEAAYRRNRRIEIKLTTR
jgi:chemotaxis protein MotB